MFLLFILILIVQEIAVLYCAYRLAFGPLHKTSPAPSLVAGIPVPDFASVRVLPLSLRGSCSPVPVVERNVHTRAPKHRCLKFQIGSSMSIAAKT